MGKSRVNILIVDDEPIKRSVLQDELVEAGYSVVTAGNPVEAEPILEDSFFDVILTDVRMPGQSGLSFLRELKRKRPEQAVIVMSGYGTVDAAVEAMKLGAFDFLQKPFSTEQFLLKLDRLFKYQRLGSENEALRYHIRAVRCTGYDNDPFECRDDKPRKAEIPDVAFETAWREYWEGNIYGA